MIPAATVATEGRHWVLRIANMGAYALLTFSRTAHKASLATVLHDGCAISMARKSSLVPIVPLVIPPMAVENAPQKLVHGAPE
jgi:hypothetical protein